MSRLRMGAVTAGAMGLLLLGCGGTGAPSPGAATGGGGGPAGIPSVAFSAPNGAQVAYIFGPGGQDEAGDALPAFNVAVADDGSVAIAQGGTSSTTSVPKLVVAPLFTDLHAAGDLTKLNASGTCDYSVFPDIYVKAANGPSSPDLKCPSDVMSQKIMSDAIAIADYLNLFAPRAAGTAVGAKM
ncbi:MAG TPA: hypothetical protein V6D47_18030 [Oscillatoriaceae cyanobacterium]